MQWRDVRIWHEPKRQYNEKEVRARMEIELRFVIGLRFFRKNWITI